VIDMIWDNAKELNQVICLSVEADDLQTAIETELSCEEDLAY